MLQSGGVICDISIFGNILSKLATKRTDIARELRKDFLDKKINKFNKEYTTSKGSGIMLTSNEMKDMKLIKSLENRGNLLKGTTTKIISQEFS